MKLAAALAIGFVSLAMPESSAQLPAVITNTYPFGASKAVASDRLHDPPLAFAASGSGVFVLDVSNPDVPHPWTGTSNFALRAGGFVWDLKHDASFLYVAAGRNGLVIYDRSTYQTVLPGLPAVGDAHAIDVVSLDVAGTQETFVFIATNDSEATGKLFGIRVTVPSAPTLLTPASGVPLGAPAYSVAVQQAPGGTPLVVVLVGMACGGGPSGNAALLEFDVNVALAQPSIPTTPTGTWANLGQPTLVRDVEFDGATAEAFAATQAGTIHKFTIAAGITELGSPWPIAGMDARFHDIELIRPTFNLLAAAAGPKFQEEQIFWGACNLPIPCHRTTSETDPATDGVLLFDASTAQQVGLLDVDPRPQDADETMLPNRPTALAARWTVGQGYFSLDVSCDVKGTQVVTALPNATGGWTLTRDGGWDLEDSVPPQTPGARSLGSIDDVTVVSVVGNPYLYAGNENGVATFDLNASPLLDKLDDFDIGPAVTLSSFAPSPGPWLFSAATTAAGVGMWDIKTNPRRPVLLGLLTTNGDVDTTFPIVGPAADGGQLWLYAVNQTEIGTAAPGRQMNGGIHVFRVGSASLPAQVPDLGRYTQSSEPPPPGIFNGHGAYIHCVARPHPSLSDSQVVWVSYGNVNSEPDVGVLTFQAKYIPQPGLDGFVRFIPLNKAGVGEMPSSAISVGKLTWDGGNRLYAALGCAGVAAYDVQDPLAPQLLGRLEVPGEVVMHVGIAPSGFIYVLFLDKGYVGTVDAANPGAWNPATPITFHATRRQAIFMAPAPTTGSETPFSRIFLADSRGGVHKIYFPQFGP